MRPLLAAALIGALLLSGCWDRRETNELSIVQVIGFDWRDGQYFVTAEVINTRAVAAPGTAGGAVGPTTPQAVIVTGHGATPAGALADLDNVNSRRIFWPSAEVLVIGEELARHGIEPLLDTFLRFPQIPITPRVAIAAGTAEDLISRRRSGVEITVGRDLHLLLHSAYQEQSSGYAPRVFDLLRWDTEQGRSPLIFGVRPFTPAQPTGPAYQLDRSAVFQGDRLAAWMPRRQVRLALWLGGRFSRATSDLACPGRPSLTGSFQIVRASERTRPVIEDGRLVAMDVRLQGRGGLLHAPCAGVSLGQLDTEADGEIRRQALEAIAWAQGGGHDVFGWGETIYRLAPAVWKADLASGWPQVFSRLPVRLEVRFTLQFTGQAHL